MNKKKHTHFGMRFGINDEATVEQMISLNDQSHTTNKYSKTQHILNKKREMI